MERILKTVAKETMVIINKDVYANGQNFFVSGIFSGT